MKSLLILFIPLIFNVFLSAQDVPLTPEERKQVVDSIAIILRDNYVFPEKGEKIYEHLQKQLESGVYDSIIDPAVFADRLTEDVRFSNDDLHLGVRFQPETIAEFRMSQSAADSLKMVEIRRDRSRRINYGFKEIKILDGNIGYLELTGFSGVTEEAGAAAEAAMNFLSNADALIIDLRNNGGGSPAMIQLITSYLYGPERVHLNNFFSRPSDEYTQTWTLPYVPGKRRPDIDVYVLTSQYTFSAAEEFTYNLKNLERATIVGEVTGGGAHPGGPIIANDRFYVWVPTGRAINPITDTNWEGTGVEPDVKVPADQALVKAQILALEKMKENATSDEVFHLEWAIAGLQSAQNPHILEPGLFDQYTGVFGPRKIFVEDGKLFYQREGNPKYEMIPMDDQVFRFHDLDYFRLKVITKEGKATELIGLYVDGRTDYNKRTGQRISSEP